MTEKTEQELADETYTADLEWLMESAQGRRIVWAQLERCGIFQTSFTSNGSMVMFREGRRDVGLQLMADIQAATPEAFLTMWRENAQIETFTQTKSSDSK